MVRRRMTARHLALLAAALLVFAPHLTMAADRGAVNDPYEALNRTVFQLNAPLHSSTATGAMTYYDRMVPHAAWQSIDNVFINLREPVAAASALVAGNIASAWNATARFAINSTAGLLGTSDVAVALGYPSERSDLGLELCRNGVMENPVFVELPLLGPADLRDIAAQIVTNIGIYTLVGRTLFYPYYVLDRLDLYLERRAAVPAAMPTDDPYAAQRDAYLGLRDQRCAALKRTVDRS